ncbi:regulatory protein MarR [Paludibacter propionicigenes WB4]|uniref:Regulatory protein MarR n=1 Tax=Paludibacter propionicigenes (strain DSM 17365 / JCM 13257 / WB4) TaxID=694427 RepID=E4T1F3_PALPW|nr:MarR family transcriptional regulator [Paludibacter propionicigenes]ADQ78547.1 regulatory protein MarR [Paludibacter propionicigenes WB4]
MKEPVGRKMDRIARMFWLELNGHLSHLDINRSFYPLLLIEAGNGITQQELANKLLCDKVQVVRIIDYLSSNGYVERVQSVTDKRKYKLTITNKARLALPDIKNAIGQTTSCAFDGLSTDSIEELYKTLSVIERNLETKEL